MKTGRGGQQATIGYFADGTIQSITPPGQPVYTFAYTPTGMVHTATLPDVGAGPSVITFDYNLTGQLRQITQPDGAQLTIGYDDSGRRQTISEPGGQIVFAYDPTTGQIHSQTAPDGGTTTYTWDGFIPTGFAWSGAVAGQVTQTYNHNLEIASQTINGGTPVPFNYDLDGLLIQAGDLMLTRDRASGFVTGSTLGGVTTIAQPDVFGAMAGFTGSFNGSALYSSQYTPDAEGRIHQVTETIGGTTNTFVYDYDANGQLRQVTEKWDRCRDLYIRCQR